MRFISWLRNRLTRFLFCHRAYIESHAARGLYRVLTPLRRPTALVSLEVLEDRTVPSTVWYVNFAASGGNTGQNWIDAFTDLQAALATAKSGDQIWVAQGTYKPTGSADRTVSFMLKDGVGVYGGFVGNESNLSQREVVNNATTLSGDIGTPGENSDNSYHVVTSSGLTSTAVLDGFTIIDGKADGPSFSQFSGGGLFNISGSPVLTNVTFSNNSANTHGGGMDNSDGAPTLSNVTFSNNSAVDGGGGMESSAGTLTQTNVTPTLTNVTFSNNSATAGGGMSNINSSLPMLKNVTFSNNFAHIGGSLYNNGGHPVLVNSLLWGNTAFSRVMQIFNVNGGSTVSFSDVQGGWLGVGNINANPLFADAAHGYLHLQDGSPAIEMGAFPRFVTTTTVTSSLLRKTFSTASQIVTLTASVAPIKTAAGVQVNEGSVTFTLLDSNHHSIATLSGNAVSQGSASAVYDLSSLAVGNYRIHAVYVPSATSPNFLGSQDKTDGTLTVVKDSTTTIVTSTNLIATYSTASQKITLSAQVSAGNTTVAGVVNEGSITFTILLGNRSVATLRGNVVSAGNASARYDLAGLPAGNYHIRAVYVAKSTNPNFTGSQDKTNGSLTVVKDSTTTIVESPRPTIGVNITLTARVAPGNSVTGGEVNEGSVMFTLIGAVLGTRFSISTPVTNGVARVQFKPPLRILNDNTDDYYVIGATFLPKSGNFSSSEDNRFNYKVLLDAAP